MKITYSTQPSDEAKDGLAALNRAVTAALERKRRLGQYAVVWKDGRPALVGGEEDPARPSQEQPRER